MAITAGLTQAEQAYSSAWQLLAQRGAALIRTHGVDCDCGECVGHDQHVQAILRHPPCSMCRGDGCLWCHWTGWHRMQGVG